jgi:nucleotide-binding universal stress UspA family protein
MNLILAAVDSSPRAGQVVAVASAMARRFGAKLVLFRAVGLPHDLPVEAYAVDPDEMVGVLEERARRELAQLAETADAPCQTRIAIGVAWEAICREARELGAGMIVIGSHGYGGLERLLGTTAARVVNHADRAVLVVRSPELLELGAGRG